MKKVVLLFISLIVAVNVVKADNMPVSEIEKKEATLVNCLSSTTSWYEIDGKVKRIRLLAFDPEDGNLNQEIDTFACEALKQAKKIEIEYDPKSLENDKYNRELAWIYVDGELLQDKLIKKGYGQVNYIKDDYQYLDNLCASEKTAIESKLGIWNYSKIEEKYCKSGISIDNKEKEQEDVSTTSKVYDKHQLYYLIFINSGIVLLLVLLFKRG